MKKIYGLVLWLVASLFIAGCAAPPAGDQQATGFDWIWIVFLVAMFAIFYFLMIRPQQKRQKEQQKLLAGLQKGDRVVTIGGIYGEIESIDDKTLVLKMESGVTIRMAKGSIAGKQEV